MFAVDHVEDGGESIAPLSATVGDDDANKQTSGKLGRRSRYLCKTKIPIRRRELLIAAVAPGEEREAIGMYMRLQVDL